jgi:hypothetical protein
MTHLSSDEYADAIEGSLASARSAHVERCGTCRTEVERLRALFHDTRRVEIPEPSPLFWAHFSRRVHDAIAAEASSHAARRPLWLRWPVLVPVTALVLAMFALMSALPRDPVTETPTVVSNTMPEAVDDLASLGEQEWAALSEIVGPVDLDAAHEAGFVSLGDADRALQELDAAEQRELLRLLQEEMGKAGG